MRARIMRKIIWQKNERNYDSGRLVFSVKNMASPKPKTPDEYIDGVLRTQAKRVRHDPDAVPWNTGVRKRVVCYVRDVFLKNKIKEKREEKLANLKAEYQKNYTTTLRRTKYYLMQVLGTVNKPILSPPVFAS